MPDVATHGSETPQPAREPKTGVGRAGKHDYLQEKTMDETFNRARFADAHPAARQSARSALKERAEHMRRQALQTIQQADQLDQLANAMAGLTGAAEEALYRLAVGDVVR